jgi:two-component system, NarL family, response regulator YdfI
MISVHVAASSAVVRAGLEAVVRSGTELSLASVDSTEHLEQHIDGIPADVLLLAIPQLTEEWIAALTAAGIPSVVITEIPDSPLLFAAFRGGIRAVLSPDARAAEITAAVRSAAAGLITVHPASLDLLNQTGRHPGDPPSDALDDPLTPREIEVLSLLAEGHSNRLIAQGLGISEHTVKFHVAAIMSKLHAGSRTDAVMQGIRHGLIMI